MIVSHLELVFFVYTTSCMSFKDNTRLHVAGVSLSRLDAVRYSHHCFGVQNMDQRTVMDIQEACTQRYAMRMQSIDDLEEIIFQN